MSSPIASQLLKETDKSSVGEESVMVLLDGLLCAISVVSKLGMTVDL